MSYEDNQKRERIFQNEKSKGYFPQYEGMTPAAQEHWSYIQLLDNCKLLTKMELHPKWDKLDYEMKKIALHCQTYEDFEQFIDTVLVNDREDPLLKAMCQALQNAFPEKDQWE